MAALTTFLLLLFLMKQNYSHESGRCTEYLENSWNGKFCKSNDTTNVPLSCYCDSLCATYRDCCRDSDYFVQEQQMWGKSPFKCITFGKSSIYVIVSCPDGEELLGPCIHPNSTCGTPLLGVPVTSSRTNLTYINGHYAICNRDFDPTVDTLWEIGLSCSSRDIGFNRICSFLSAMSAEEIVQECVRFEYNWKLNLTCSYIKYLEHMGLAESQIEILDNQHLNCDLDSRVPDKIRLKLRECHSDVQETCPPTWNDVHIQTRCESYQDLCEANGVYYRNPYCHFCWENYNYWYHNRSEQDGAYPQSPSFKILLFWNYNDNSTCDQGEVYDKLWRTCRKLPKVISEKLVLSNETANYTDEIASTADYLQTYITNTGLTISIVSLVLHLVAFLATPKLMILPAMNIASLSTSLLILYCCFIASEFLEPPCVALAVIMHYSLMASFTWMLVISFDVWKAIRNTVVAIEVGKGEKMRFARYSLMAWSLPALLVAIPLTMQLAGLESDFGPDYGKVNCWISSKYAVITFVVAPLCLVMLLNVCFFSWTAWLIHTIRSRVTKTRISTVRADFKLFLRLAFLMGLTWITGVVATFSNYEAVWLVFILLNTLQGLFIFVAFTCRKKMRRELMTKFGRSCLKYTRTAGTNVPLQHPPIASFKRRNT